MKMRSSYNFDYGLKIKRLLDICMSIFLIIALLPLLGVIAVLIKTTSNGPIFFWSIRVGLENAEFNMPKFRTMKINAPVIATHLFGKSGEFLTPIGSALRRASLDELPQLWSILIGDMSFVGPRPALFNQQDLIRLRTEYGINKLTPGLTGWAQINGRDDLLISEKVKFDLEYLQRQSICFDLKILLMTFSKVIRQVGIVH